MDKKLYWISIALTVLGVLVSIYMTVYKLTDNRAMCLGSGDCSTVNASKYSMIGGVIPVAVLGVLGYLAILCFLTLEKRGGKFFEKNATLAVFGLSLTGFIFTLYLVYIEVYELQAYCPFCITSQVTMTILFIITIIRLVKQPAI
jgi:uncharacterized membrane protein